MSDFITQDKMLSNFNVYENKEFGSIRTVVINNEPWFVGKDVALVLGYKKPRNAIEVHVDEEDKDALKQGTLGGAQNMTIINESGLYALIFSSKMPNAKKFKHWVTSEVLPEIRKTGSYGQPALFNPDGTINVDFALLQLQELKLQQARNAELLAVNEALEDVIVEKDEQISVLGPKALYCDYVLKSKDAVAITMIAKDYGMSPQRMNKLLHEFKVQHKCGKSWVLNQPYADKGYTKTETIAYDKHNGNIGSNIFMKWTQRGRIFIYNLLKKHGILPMMEREEQRSFYE